MVVLMPMVGSGGAGDVNGGDGAGCISGGAGGGASDEW